MPVVYKSVYNYFVIEALTDQDRVVSSLVKVEARFPSWPFPVEMKAGPLLPPLPLMIFGRSRIAIV